LLPASDAGWASTFSRSAQDLQRPLSRVARWLPMAAVAANGV
jgi:hypothetical protein